MNLKLASTFAALAAASIFFAQLHAADRSPATLERAAAGDDEGGVAAGPDVFYININGINGFGPVGGVRAYILGSDTCNSGTSDLLWTNDGTPGLFMNAYRLHDGRLMQIGMGFGKTACCAIAGSGCGSCNGHSGSVLGAGCKDVYSASFNSSQSALTPRSGINAFTGTFSPIPPGTGNAIWRRMQIAEIDMMAANFPGAIYFVEGQYISTDDAAAGNQHNNNSYSRVNISPSFAMSLTGGTQAGQPAINAWRANGLGVGVVDPSVTNGVVSVPGEGRFLTATKVRDNLDGTWTYDYAIFNQNSHRSGASLSIPVPESATVTNIGFHDVNYHSGDPFDNTDWSSTRGAGALTWSSPQTFAQNPNSNALRFGTMYSFWFTTDRAPAPGTATLGLFRPGAPDSVVFSGPVPSEIGDLDLDGTTGPADLGTLLGGWGQCPAAPVACPADLDHDGVVGPADLAQLLAHWG
jgi:hypothetical protein